MANLFEIDTYLREFLGFADIPDFAAAHNGIQIENSGRDVRRIAAAVDSQLPVLQQAVERGAGLLLVHHGLFWQGVQPVTGAFYRKLKLALEHDLALLSVHHPLDAHPTVGNNACLATGLGLKNGTPFFPYQGVPIGLKFEVNLPRQELRERLESVLGGRVHLAAAGPEVVRVAGICSGGAGGEVASVVREGVDTFITGEGPHWSHTLAEDLGINLFLGGHYATETFGVKALASHLAQRFGLEWEFLDHPTGL